MTTSLREESRRTLLADLMRQGAGEVVGLLTLLVAVVVLFSLTAPGFLSEATFRSVAFQLPELGLLTLAMLIPILSGGLNLAITYTANIAALVAAWIMLAHGGPSAGVGTFLVAVLAALATGAVVGGIMGMVIAYTGAHPILVSLSMMIFLRGLGQFVTRGGDVSGFPRFVAEIGHGSVFGIPIPLLVFLACAIAWNVLMRRTPLGFSIYMLGSNIRAVEFSGVNARRSLTFVYVLSGVMSAIAGLIMMARFNSVRVGHGASYLLITVLACFLGRVDPFGGFGRTTSVVLALVILQVIASGLNVLGASQHLASALWGVFLIAVMIVRSTWPSASRAWSAWSRRRSAAPSLPPRVRVHTHP
jgi:simple sugar transport system permease protein